MLEASLNYFEDLARYEDKLNWHRIVIRYARNTDGEVTPQSLGIPSLSILPNRTVGDPQPSYLVPEDALLRLRRDSVRLDITVQVLGPYVRGQGRQVQTAPQPPMQTPQLIWNNNPFDPPELQAARGAKTIEELSRNISTLRGRIPSGGIESAKIDEGDVWIDKSGKVEVRRRKKKTVEVKSSLKEAESTVKAELLTYKYPDGIPERMAKVLTEKNGSYVTELTNEISRLRSRQSDLTNELVAKTVVFQFEKFLNGSVPSLKRKLAKDAEKRSKVFAKLGSLFDEEPKRLVAWFDESADKFITETLGGTTAATALNKTLKDLTEVTALVETKSLALSGAGVKWKDEVLSKVKEHLIKMSEADFVKKIDFAYTTLKVLIGPVIVKSPEDGKRYYIGDIEVQLNLSSVSASPQNAFVLYNPVIGGRDEHHTPHVKSFGKTICWGSAWDSAANLFSTWNWTVLIGFLWKYVCSYNPHSRFYTLREVSKFALEEAKKQGIAIPAGCETTVTF